MVPQVPEPLPEKLFEGFTPSGHGLFGNAISLAFGEFAIARTIWALRWASCQG